MTDKSTAGRRQRTVNGTRVAWVTGAGKGIGRALALELARRGVTVAVSARTEADLETLAAEHPRLHPFPVDVTDEAAMAATAEAIRRDLGEVDLAVFNAGTHKPVDGRTFSAQPFRTLMEVNVMGVIHGLAAVVPRMVARRAGHVAIMGSVSGYRGLPTAAAYGASKAALNNMAEALKPELESCGVSVSIINPGFVRTPLTDRNDFHMPFLVEPEYAAEKIVRGLEAKRFEIAFPFRMAVFMKLAKVLPQGLYFALTRRMVRHR
ncbi:Oxidoreductase, short-chain dehydrogenase/reductase family [Caenispirillum salinarum AK4]|uniref:Oxidoreductase, short-chain dehydrogenase/reductase family n=1 Tax=Caenispirillum salinarum AK4 TaxID=1238182 RepID=K9GUE5_9PROT|nr:SDR family NAD(P)-dependent oxidoreductase [Caenispirillum salinarum]EKV29570.1 Oxidoreductase, short-chain dehydrogenase/reductase family [Caenispirillum salinarum AK4]